MNRKSLYLQTNGKIMVETEWLKQNNTKNSAGYHEH